MILPDKYHISLWSMHFSLDTTDLKFGTPGFSGSLIANQAQHLEIKNAGLNMVDQNATSYLIGIKVYAQRFLESLITYLSSKFTNSKCGIQYGGKKCKKYFIGIKFGTRGFLKSLINNPSSTFINPKWWMQYGGPKYKKLRDWDKIYFSGHFLQSRILNPSYWGTNLLGIIVVILDTLSGILIFSLQIRNQQPQKSLNTEFHPNAKTFFAFISIMFDPPFWVNF